MDKLQTAFLEIQRALDDSKRQVDDARKREAELEVAMEAEREAFRSREAALLDANARLLSRVDELSGHVARLQAEIVDLTRRQNMSLIRGPVAGSMTTASPRAPAPAAPASADPSAMLSTLDRSLEGMRASAAADLERYTARLMARLRTGGADAGALPLPGGAAASALLAEGSAGPASPTQFNGRGVSMTMSMTPPLGATPMSASSISATSGIGATAMSTSGAYPVFETTESLRPVHSAPNSGSKTSARSTDAAAAAGGGGTALKAAPPPAPRGSARAGQKNAAPAPAAAPTGYAAKAAARTSIGGGGTRGQGQTQGNAPAAGSGAGPTATPSRPEIRAAPYDELRMEAHGSTHAGVAPGTAASGAEEDYDEDVRPAATQHGGAASAPSAPASAPASGPAAPPKKLSAVEFFSLLRSHLPPTSLESLMSALALFNSHKISKTDLMGVAQRALHPSDADMQSHRLPRAPFDLMAAFEEYMRKS